MAEIIKSSISFALAFAIVSFLMGSGSTVLAKLAYVEGQIGRPYV